MGIYVNPPDQDKIYFLQRYGIELSPLTPLDQVWDEERQLDELPVILIDHGTYSSAGIAFSRPELERQMQDDGKARRLYLVRIDHLRTACSYEVLISALKEHGTEYITETPDPSETEALGDEGEEPREHGD